jgi:cation diffusion facilitator CzcD-associated flavoprotein CzcO
LRAYHLVRASCHQCSHKAAIAHASLLQGRPGYTRLITLERSGARAALSHPSRDVVSGAGAAAGRAQIRSLIAMAQRQSPEIATEYDFIPKSVLEATPEERESEFDRMWDAGGFAFWLANYQDMFFNQEANDLCADYIKRKIRKTVKDPVVAEKLIPKGYAYGTKRQPLDTNYYETFNKDNVLLADANTDGGIEEVTEKGIRAGGREYECDIIVFATGFDAMTGPLKALNLKGRGGRTLDKQWADGPHTYLGISIAGFPNLFTITGPQSPSVLSNMPVSIEQHVDWITDCIDNMRKNGKTTIEATPQAQDQWVAHVNEIVNKTLMTGANSWYMSANIAGKPRAFLPYLGPEGVGGYRRKCDEIAAKGYEGFELA